MGKMQRISGIWLITMAVTFMAPLSATQAQQVRAQEEDAVYHLGSGVLTLLYFPLKLVTCASTQVVTATAYVSTYGVPGNFQGGTNGKEIGEVARGACGGPWYVSFDQVKTDYQAPAGMGKTSAKAPAREPTADTKTTPSVTEKIVVKEVIKEVPKVVEVEKVLFPDIAFSFDSADLTDLGKGRVHLAAQKIKAKSDVVLVLGGHTDYIGTPTYNEKLALRRAETVKRELVSLGIDTGKLMVEGFGEFQPLIDQQTDWARAVNRRVEIKIKGAQ